MRDGVGQFGDESFDRHSVVLWLARDMDERTDDNTFLASYFFAISRPDWTCLLGDDCAARVMERIEELHVWQYHVCAEKIARPARTERVLVPSDFVYESTTFAIQRVAQALYYLRYFGRVASKQLSRSLEELRMQLMPHLQQFIRGGICSSSHYPWATSQDSKLSVALAVVNTVMLFARVLFLMSMQDLEYALAMLRQMYMVEDYGQMDLYSKASIIAHIGLNCQGQCGFVHVAWLFDYFDSLQPQLLASFEDLNNPRRDIILDLVAEIITCYRYFHHHTPHLEHYMAFMRHEVQRKYCGHFSYRYYAHADLPSDHEAVSLYHMFISGNT